ncbi:hypothetical protein HGRIS_010517 [Hohenbuehelia grisea]|uniref:Uncharacterized protein n=1 Tax=Hohenbuehelia grisea TaxID=104357 RepID=A0ABR3IXB4_9AGAR
MAGPVPRSHRRSVDTPHPPVSTLCCHAIDRVTATTFPQAHVDAMDDSPSTRARRVLAAIGVDPEAISELSRCWCSGRLDVVNGWKETARTRKVDFWRRLSR